MSGPRRSREDVARAARALASLGWSAEAGTAVLGISRSTWYRSVLASVGAAKETEGKGCAR